MAYVSKDNKADKAPKLRALAKEYGLKATVAVRHHSTLVLNISEGWIDFVGNYANTLDSNGVYNETRDEDYEYRMNLKYLSINTYWYHEQFTGKALEFLTKAMAIMQTGNHDRSDIMSDYFDVGWYVDVNIGRWDKPYRLTGAKEPKKELELAQNL